MPGHADASSLTSSVTANATLRAQLEKHCSEDLRDQWVADVKNLGKQGRIAAQWYPGYNAKFMPVPEIDFSTVNLFFWFVQATEEGGLNTTVDGPLDELVLYAGLHNIPVVATVGGWIGGLWFSSIVANETGRQTFAEQISDFVTEHYLSGFEIDWEYPGSSNNVGCNNVSKSDTDNLGLFLKDLRKELGPNRLITIDVPGSGILNSTGQTDMDLADWSEPLDYFNLMNYDVYGPWQHLTGPNAPLADVCNAHSAKTGAIAAVNLFTDAGVPESKLLLGMPAYAHSYTTKRDELHTRIIHNVKLVNGSRVDMPTQIHQLHTSATPEGGVTDSEGIDVCGNFQSWSGIWLYKTLIDYGFLSADGKKGLNGWTRYWDECSSTPFLYTHGNNTFISYDDADSLAMKASWAQDRGIAGTTIFDSTGPTRDVLQAVKMSTYDRAALWRKGIMTVENATVLFDRPPDK